LHNLYGPTEAAVDVTWWRCESEQSERSVPIGRPIANTQIYILDRHQQPVPLGVAGEIHIGGAGLARGYLKRASLTAERFIPNPFSRQPGERLYKTGDLARYRRDGAIEYLGRSDHQVKIRGFRIELEEIEAVLVRQNGVREAIVLARADGTGDKHLVGYVVKEADAWLPVSVLRGLLKEELPEYMIPKAFVFLEELPLTPNGKVDRRSLPAPVNFGVERERPYVAPRTPIEKELASTWSELLHIEQVGIHDNFFDLGGHSLLLTQLASRISQNFHVDLPLRILFDVPTVEEMTVAIAQRQVEQEQDLEVAQMLDELKQMTPEEVKALLEAEANEFSAEGAEYESQGQARSASSLVT
ncbi:MAG TPA: non-ribosomal peptide synthetase, partial [Pyrinomonadaceae bacterium]